jgi:hypothetical protein
MDEEGEQRKVTILWEVKDDTQAGIDSVKRRQQQATDQLMKSANGPAGGSASKDSKATAKAAADLEKVARAAENVATPLERMGAGITGAASGTKKLAEQATGVIGKFSGMAGAAGVAVAAIGGIIVATVEWAAATEEVDKKNRKIEESYRRMVNHYDEVAASKAAKRVIINEQAARQEERRVDTAEENALAVEHLAKMSEIEGGNQAEVNALMIEALMIRQELVGAATKEGVALGRQIEILEAQSAKPKRGAGGSGPSAADKLRVAGEARIQLLNDEIALSESLYDLNGTAAASELGMIERRRGARMAELELERQVLAATRAKSSVERAQNDNRQAQIGRELELVNIEAQIDARRIENGLAAEALDLAQARQEIEGRAAGRIVDLADARLSRSIEQAKLDGDEARVHALTLTQIQQQGRAREKVLDVRERELLISNPTEEIDQIRRIDDLEQVAHDRELSRLETGLAAQQAVAAEEERLATEKEARLQKTIEDANAAIGTFENIQGSAVSTFQGISSYYNELQDADREVWKANLEDRTKAQSAAFDRQIEGAKNNAGLRRDLERRKLANEKASQKQIEAAETAHNEKRKRNEMRFQGIMLLVQAAVQTAKAAAAYPVVPSMIAHGIAAGLNAAYGAILIAGRVPGAGGGSVGGGGGSSGTAPSQSDRSSKEVNRVPESVGGRAAERQGGRGRTVGGSSGSVTFAGNVTINALGSIDEDAAVKIGMAVNTGKHIREGSAIK